MADFNELTGNPGRMIGQPGMPAVIIPRPFSLSRHNLHDRMKIKEEILDKMRMFERHMNEFYQQWQDTANSWRMIPLNKKRADRGLFNSKTGETNRAVTTLATLWFRMLTAADPYIETYAQGTGAFGVDYTDEELYGVRELIMEQHRELKFKQKLLKALRSLAAFGTVIVEKHWVQMPTGITNKYFEGTDFRPRSLMTCGFDPNVSDLDFSDFVYTVDYLSKYKLQQMAATEGALWEESVIKDIIGKNENEIGNSEKKESRAWQEILQRKQNAGYSPLDTNVLEQITYYGKLDINNPIFEDYWEKEGRTDDIRFTDWTIGLLSAEDIDRFHATPMGTWKHMFEVAHYNQFEEETIGYGVGRLGNMIQKELDTTMSRANDAMMMAVYTMWKMGKFAGLNINQLNIKPFHVIQLDDVDQLQQLKVDMNTIVQALSIQNARIEDFRATTGATTNLQAISTQATATEASLTQSEAMRSGSVAAEIIGETLMRNYVKTQHINNSYLLDEEILVNIFGPNGSKMLRFNKDNIPFNVGFRVKITTDKDFRPERIKRLLELINLSTSIRQIMPDSMNAVEPLFKEAFRLMGMDPILLQQPKKIPDLLSERLQRLGKANAGADMTNELAGEVQGEVVGAPSISAIETPVGSVPASPPSSISLGGY